MRWFVSWDDVVIGEGETAAPRGGLAVVRVDFSRPFEYRRVRRPFPSIRLALRAVRATRWIHHKILIEDASGRPWCGCYYRHPAWRGKRDL